MKLPAALRKSDHKAAIFLYNRNYWGYIIVQHAPHEYTTEVLQYKRDGNLDFHIISYNKIGEQLLRVKLGEETYFSDSWEPYDNKTKPVKKPPLKKDVPEQPMTEADWERILDEVGIEIIRPEQI